MEQETILSPAVFRYNSYLRLGDTNLTDRLPVIDMRIGELEQLIYEELGPQWDLRLSWGRPHISARAPYIIVPVEYAGEMALVGYMRIYSFYLQQAVELVFAEARYAAFLRNLGIIAMIAWTFILLMYIRLQSCLWCGVLLGFITGCIPPLWGYFRSQYIIGHAYQLCDAADRIKLVGFMGLQKHEQERMWRSLCGWARFRYIMGMSVMGIWAWADYGGWKARFRISY